MLKSDLTRIALMAPRIAEAALLQTAADVVNIAKQLVPVDTGALRDSIEVTPISNTEVMVSAGKENEVEYGPYVEFGTEKMISRPFFVPAFDQAEEIFKARLMQGFEAEI